MPQPPEIPRLDTRRLDPARAEDLAAAVDLLRAGRLVAVPTETVYGLAADARNPGAVRGIFAAKGRPSNHPLIVHLPDAAHLSRWAVDIPDAAWRLAEAFWPGPLTLLLPRAPDVPGEVTGGRPSIGLRVPAHPVMHALLLRLDGGLAAPSANPYQRLSPTTADQVLAGLDGRIDAVLDGAQLGDTHIVHRPLRARPGAEQMKPKNEDGWKTFLAGFSLTMGNPKTIVFYLAILPTVIPLDQMTPLAFAELTAIVVVVLLLIGCGYAWLAAAARQMFTSPRALGRLNKTAGAMMATAAGLVVWQH